MLRNRPLPQQLFFLLIVVTIIAAPILLIVAGEDEYEGLKIRDSKLARGVAGGQPETRLTLLLDNDGDRKVRIIGFGARGSANGGEVLEDLDLRYNPDGTARARLRKFDRFELDPQRRRYMEFHRTLPPCDGGSDEETVREIVVRFEVFGGTQERTFRLPEQLDVPRCA